MLDWSQTAHSFKTALALAEASQAAYRKVSTPQAWSAKHGFAVQEEFANRGMFGFSATKEARVLLIAFRGTDEPSDWKVNGNMDPKETAGVPGTVHDGFWNHGWAALRDRVLSVLEQNTHPQVWITGHSLGGAIATCLRAELLFGKSQRNVTGMYTFGQPRVGDDDFRGALDRGTEGRYHRYVNHNDVVPLVPPKLLGYRHAGAPIRFNRDGEPETQDSLRTRVSGLADRVDAIFTARRTANVADLLEDLHKKPTEGLAEHGIDRYIALLDKAVQSGL